MPSQLTSAAAIVVGALFASGQHPSTVPQGSRLNQEWRVHLGSTGERLLYRAAVCGDGVVYFTDGTGRVVALSADGRLLTDARDAQFEGTKALACGPEGNLILGLVQRGVPRAVIVQLDGAMLRAKSSRVLTDTPFAIASSGDAVYYVSPSRGKLDGELSFLFRFARQDDRPSRFGRAPSQIHPDLDLPTLSLGNLVWDLASRELAFVAASPYEASFYSSDGKFLRIAYRADAGFRGFQFDILQGRVIAGDQVINAAALPRGRLLTFVLKRTPNAPSSTYLEVLDSRFKPIVTGVRSPGGVLIGADGNGNPYFARINRSEGINILRTTWQLQ